MLSSRIAQTMRDLSIGMEALDHDRSFGPGRTGVVFAVQDDMRESFAIGAITLAEFAIGGRR